MSLLVFLGLSSILSNAYAQEASPALREVSVDPGERSALRLSAERLPRGVTGVLPSEDGAFFALIVEEDVFPASSTEEIQKALDEILPSLGFEGSAREFYPSLEGDFRPTPDLDAVEELGKGMAEDELKALEERVGSLSETTAKLMRQDIEEVYAQVAADRQIWRFEQYVDAARAEGRGLIVETDGRSIRRITGALFVDTAVSNRVELGAEKAAAIAERYASDEEGVVKSDPELVVLADGGALRNAWHVEVETQSGPYQIWVDASDGEIVQVFADFASISAQGREALPTLPLTFEVAGFEVDSASACKFTLDFAPMLTMSNAGADGVTADAKACVNGSGDVDFDVSPNNGTTNITNANGASYNGLFQQVSAFSQVYDTLDWFDMLGSAALPVWSVTVNHNNPCGFGIDNACGGYGNLTLGIGGVTMGTFGGLLINTALDQSVIVHETGHGLNRAQMKAGGGTLNGSFDEGMADYWAMTKLQSDIVGVVTTNTTSDVETGFIPRRADAPDVFPEHMQNNNEIHANGQIIARAMWDSRAEMKERSLVGPLFNDLFAMQAMVGQGVGQNNSSPPTFKSVHDAYWSMMVNMLLEAGGGQTAEDILVGFARAGITATSQESVIDISDDILSDLDGAPTFTVWSGQDYDFSGNTLVNSSPYNTRFEVEVANDASFTKNLVSSGTQSISINNLVPSGTWTLAASDWKALREGEELYFRATTWTPNDPDSVRTSTHWYGEFVEIAPSRAIINHSGGGGCSTAGSRVSGLLGLALAGAALLRRRS